MGYPDNLEECGMSDRLDKCAMNSSFTLGASATG